DDHHQREHDAVRVAEAEERAGEAVVEERGELEAVRRLDAQADRRPEAQRRPAEPPGAKRLVVRGAQSPISIAASLARACSAAASPAGGRVIDPSAGAIAATAVRRAALPAVGS